MPTPLPVLMSQASASRKTSMEMVVVENFGACNMKCQYCFPESMWQRSGYTTRMPIDRLERCVAAAMSLKTSDTIHVRFAGGEPLLAGIRWLSDAVSTCRGLAKRANKRVVFSVQTNATHVSKELAAFLRDNSFEVGVSVDGPPAINEMTRGKTSATLEGFETLKDAIGRPPGVIVTVTKCNALRMHDVIDFLSSMGVLFFRANLVGGASDHLRPTSVEFATCRQDILREIADRNGRIMEYNLSESLRKLDSWVCKDVDPFSSNYGCHGQRCPAGDRLMYFNQRGEAYACPRANVSKDTVITTCDSQQFVEDWSRARSQLDDGMRPAEDCLDCAARLVCDFGCHAFNTSDDTYFGRNCSASKKFYEFVTLHLNTIAAVVAQVHWRNEVRENKDFGTIAHGIATDSGAAAEWAALCSKKLADWHTSNFIRAPEGEDGA